MDGVWDLSALYLSFDDPAYSQDVKKLEQMMEQYRVRVNQVHQTADTLDAACFGGISLPGGANVDRRRRPAEIYRAAADDGLHGSADEALWQHNGGDFFGLPLDCPDGADGGGLSGMPMSWAMLTMVSRLRIIVL